VVVGGLSALGTLNPSRIDLHEGAVAAESPKRVA